MQFDSYLWQFDAASIKRFARPYLGKEATKLRKDSCLQALARALSDPEVMQRVAASLEPFEQFALYLIRRSGGNLFAVELAGALLQSGYPFRHGYGTTDQLDLPLRNLTNQGLAILSTPANPYSTGYGYGYYSRLSGGFGRTLAFSDERLLRFVAPCPPRTLEIEPAGEPAHAVFRRPAEVALDLTRVVEAVGRGGGLPLTRAGRPTRPGMTRVAKALGTASSAVTGLAVPLEEPAGFLVGLVQAAGILGIDSTHGKAQVTTSGWRRLEEPFEQQAVTWAAAYQALTGWAELLPKSYYGPDELHSPGKVNALRAATLTALAALPDPTRWYRLGDLAAAMEKALTGKLSLLYLPPFYAFGRSEQERRAQAEQHAKKVRDAWQQSEVPWLEAAFRGPLFHLGLVELGAIEGGEAAGIGSLLFRLSESGRAALWESYRAPSATPGQPPAPAAPPEETPAPGCWVIQSNLDVVVYMDRVTADRLAFIGRVAENQSSLQNTATYRLTRTSVYRALESGMDLGAILRGLAAGSEMPLTSTVERTLADWAARRERIRIRKSATLLEFPDPEARDAAAAALGAGGSPVGERFLRIEGGKLLPELKARVRLEIDYRGEPRQCLEVAEAGTVTEREPLDLLVRELLSRWAEPVAGRPGAWKLTAESIRRAAAGGHPLAELENALSDRSTTETIPRLLQVALRAWASGKGRDGASVSTETLLHLEDPLLVAAIETSPALKPYLRRQLGPGTFLVDAGRVEELKALLHSYGIRATDALPASTGKRAPTAPPPVFPEMDEAAPRRGRRRR